MTSRRELIQRVGALGGLVAAYAAMREIGLMGADVAYAGPPKLAPGSGKGASVVILGGGLAGLAAAWELGKAGYSCTILEARDRVGGRSWTMRKGSVLELTDGSRQVAGFDEGLYFNAGPARIPSHHQATLGYCREFGVELETLVNASRSALLQSDAAFGGKPIQMRQAIYDLRGHVCELLAKAANQGALGAQVTPEDKERLVGLLRYYGNLKPDLVYRGSSRSGYATPPGAAGEMSTARDPIDLSALLSANIWGGALFEDDIDMQCAMLQPVGGMDRIPAAFEARLRGVIRRGCEVRRIGRKPGGVEITFLERKTGRTTALKADYCLCAIPLTVLRLIEADFAPAYKDAIRTVPYADAAKTAFQSPRFWEREDQIYGGMSFTDRETNIVWYPSGGYHQPSGVILGAYNFDFQAAAFGKRPLPDQIAYAKGSIERLHPGRSGGLSSPMSIHWTKVPYNLGPWVAWGENTVDPRYTLLNQPDGPFFFAGEHLSQVSSWQQGAFLSAQYAAAQIDARHRHGRAVADFRDHRPSPVSPA